MTIIQLIMLKKLVPNFFEKDKYVFHCKNLQYYLRFGLTWKIHSELEFDQSKWLKPCITRIGAEKNGGKDVKVFCKLINNAMYGKTLENSRNSVDIRMVNNKIIFEIDIKIELHNTKIFDKD